MEEPINSSCHDAIQLFRINWFAEPFFFNVSGNKDFVFYFITVHVMMPFSYSGLIGLLNLFFNVSGHKDFVFYFICGPYI